MDKTDCLRNDINKMELATGRALQTTQDTCGVSRYPNPVFDSKAKLEAQTHESIDAMILAYATEAVALARSQHRLQLDYSPASVATLERLMDGQAAVDLEFQSRLWGSYFGEVLRRRWDGAWLLAPYPGGQADAVVPTLDVAGSRLWPTMKVYRRLTLGSSENLADFYRLVEERLGKPALRPN